MDDTILIRGRWVVTGAAKGDAVLSDGALLIEGETIKELGKASDLEHRYPEARRLGGDGYAVLPGLINAHHHSNGVTTLQHGVPDDLLESWLLRLARCRPLETRAAVLLGAYRLLRSGVTAVVDMFSGGGTEESFAAGVGDALAAYEESGLRAAVAAGVSSRSLLVAGEDEAFVNALGPGVRPLAERRLSAGARFSEDAYFDIMADLGRRYAAHSRISLWFGPPGPQWVSEAMMVRIAEAAERLDCGIQTHALESFYEKLHGPRAYGKPTLLHLRDLGVLSPRFSIAHGVWLTEDEIEVLAESGAAVSHNPSSNLRLRAGIAPVNALLAAGVTVGLGMDATSLDDDDDFFTEMRLALRLHGTPQLDGPAPAPHEILALATTGGARLLRAEQRLGRLAPGYAADVVLVGLERLSWPWIAPECEPRELVLLRARADDVDTVLIAGEVVLEAGRPTRFDHQAVGRAIADALSNQAPPADAADIEALLLPEVEAHYRDWEAPASVPYVSYNSRR